MNAQAKKDLKAKKEQVLDSFQNARTANTFEVWQSFDKLVNSWYELASLHSDYKSVEETRFYREKAHIGMQATFTANDLGSTDALAIVAINRNGMRLDQVEVNASDDYKAKAYELSLKHNNASVYVTQLSTGLRVYKIYA